MGPAGKILEEKSGLGSGRRWPGAVAASGRLGMVPADPWPRGKVTPAPFKLRPPFAGRCGAVVALSAADLLSPGEDVITFQVAGAPGKRGRPG
jgi:hypothetical protein